MIWVVGLAAVLVALPWDRALYAWTSVEGPIRYDMVEGFAGWWALVTWGSVLALAVGSALVRTSRPFAIVAGLAGLAGTATLVAMAAPSAWAGLRDGVVHGDAVMISLLTAAQIGLFAAWSVLVLRSVKTVPGEGRTAADTSPSSPVIGP